MILQDKHNIYGWLDSLSDFGEGRIPPPPPERAAGGRVAPQIGEGGRRVDEVSAESPKTLA